MAERPSGFLENPKLGIHIGKSPIDTCLVVDGKPLHCVASVDFHKIDSDVSAMNGVTLELELGDDIDVSGHVGYMLMGEDQLRTLAENNGFRLERAE